MPCQLASMHLPGRQTAHLHACGIHPYMCVRILARAGDSALAEAPTEHTG